MSKTYSEETKQKVVEAFSNYLKTVNEKDRNITAFCKVWGVSPRSLGRWYQAPAEPEPELSDLVDLEAVDYTGLKFTISNNNIQLFLGSENKTIVATNSYFDAIFEALGDGDYALAWQYADLATAVEAQTYGALHISEDGCFLSGHRIEDTMTQKLWDMITGGDLSEAKIFAMFMQNLYKNPNQGVVKQLYAFLKHNCIELNEDGSFYGWKGIRMDMTDQRTGKIDNSVGSTVTMPRNMVDSNPNHTCSAGLHVGSKEYASNWGERLVKVKVWPQNVVSVPTDYNGQKMRTCEYEVIEDHGNCSAYKEW